MPKISLYADFVGRKAELEALNQWIATPAGEALIVTANAGTGKSYLLGKLAEDLDKEKHRYVFRPRLAGDPAPVDLGYLALEIVKRLHAKLDKDTISGHRSMGLAVLD